MDIGLKKKVGYFLLSLAAIYLVLVAALSIYYKNVLIKPIDVWQGSHVAVNALVASNEGGLFIERDAVAETAKYLKDTKVETSDDVSSVLEQTDDFSMRRMEREEQLVLFQADQQDFQQRQNKLEQTDQQLRQNNLTLESLNQDYGRVAAYNQAQASQRSEINQLIEDSDALLGEGRQQSDSFLANQSQVDENEQKIPQNVLDNIQRTSGVSADEINELFNRQ